MANRERFKKLTDLFVQGKHVRLPDGSYLWVQVLNTYERDECISAAQVARARLVMALRRDGDEAAKVVGHVLEHGHDLVAGELASIKVDNDFFKIINGIRDDPEWKERIDIIDNTDLTSLTQELSREEMVLLERVQDEFVLELERRKDEVRELALMEYKAMSDEEIEEAYLEAWLDKRGSEAGQAEYSLQEMALAVRFSDAHDGPDGELDPATANRGERVFTSAAEVRAAPQELQDIIRVAMSELAMSERDPKDSGSPTDSSASSPTPSAPEASTPSTSTATPAPVPGTSSLQSAIA